MELIDCLCLGSWPIKNEVTYPVTNCVYIVRQNPLHKNAKQSLVGALYLKITGSLHSTSSSMNRISGKQVKSD